MRVRVGVCLLSAFASASAAHADEPDAPSPAPEAVVLVDRCPDLDARRDAVLAEDSAGLRITAGELASFARSRPVVERERACTAEGLVAALEELVRVRVLAAEAERTGLAARVDVRHEVGVVLSRAFAREALSSEGTPRPSASDVRTYYEAHIAEYTRPARVKVLAVWVESERDARRVRGMLDGANEAKFGRVSARFSTDRRLRSRRGELGWFSAESVGNDPLIVAAALSLERPGQMTAEPVRTANGDYVWLRLVERVEPEAIPLEELARAVESRMLAERRAAAIADFVSRAGRRTQLRVAPPARWLP